MFIKSRNLNIRKKSYWTGKSKAASVNKQNGPQKFYVGFGFSNESFTLHEIEKLKTIPLPTAAVKEDTNMFNSEFREGIGLWTSLMAI